MTSLYGRDIVHDYGAGGEHIYLPRFSHRRQGLSFIRGYGGLNICFVYNYAPQSWRAQLPAETQTALTAQKRYRGFPWYATFGQNAPRVIRLDERQVNLLANLTAWAVTDSWSVDTMCRALGAALGCGPAQ